MSDTPYRARLLEKDTNIALESFTCIQAASEGGILGRLALNTSTACDGLSSAVSATINRVTLQASKDVQEQAKRLCASRDKRFGWQCEEFDAAKAMLEGIDRQLCVGNVDCINFDAIDASLRTVGQLVEEATTLPSHSALLAVTGGVCTSDMSHLQLDVDVGTSAVSHADRMKRGQGNIVTLSCRDAFGAPVRTVRAEDVTVGLTALATGWSVDVEGVEEGVVAVRVTPGDEGELTVTLVVDVVNTRIQAPLQAGSTIVGTHITTFALENGRGNSGLAISRDGALMVVCDWNEHKIAVYNLASGELQSSFGGRGTEPGLFSFPIKACFSPATGNLLIADCYNGRIQEMTLAGAYVRAIGEGDLDCPVYGVDTSPELLLVCGLSSIEQVFLFDLASGAHLRSLGPTGPAAGQLAGSRGLRLTPDGAHILVAEYNNNRLSFFTLTGEFVRCMGSGVVVAPSAIEFATNGDILVASQGNDCVYVYSPDGSTLLRTLGAVEEGADALLVGPTALALHGDQLYVLNQNDARVQVFN